ncbi:EthD family reductase [Siminovitchia acidinfaciens]|uniref:EthD family reductase n=1 Tax=Siminovitchia acidinfaciens TaxID=2321395 RepID=A0A429Y1I6_9BACI|nr:EthD family reductase [Siminovitchia acidinfaciens]RST75103.1 EthD family reductase [Siminovitchia acidinfaciens]VEF48824.1 ethyl tert-butyl ether degradation EthD [Bacillus freudenreichii]
MFKMIALFKKPENTEEFDKYYFETHIPLTEKIPGLRKVEITKFTGSPMGESPYYLMCEMYYDSFEAFKDSSKTEESKASGKDVMKFAGDIVTFMFGEEVNE